MRAAVAVLALIAAACLLAPLYATFVSGTDPFRPQSPCCFLLRINA